MARSFAATGDFRAAERHLLKLMDLPRPPSHAFFELSSLYIDYGRFPKCIEWAKRRVVAFGVQRDGWALSNLADFYLHLGMNEESDYWIEKSMEFDSDPMNEFFRRSYRLKVQGRFDEIQMMFDEVAAAHSIDVSRLTRFSAEVIGAVHVMSGDYDKGIQLLESVYEPETSRGDEEGALTGTIDFMQILAFAYQNVGRNEDAEALLREIEEDLDYLEQTREIASPDFLETRTLQHAMRGEMGAAAHTFERAVDTGWRDYYFIEHDPRWQDFLALPAAQSQLAFVRADLERQRELVRAADASDDFRDFVESILAGR